MRVILASASPRRKELLAGLKDDFEVLVSDVEEVVTQNDPARVVEELSDQKAQAVFSGTEGDVLVIGADTVVALDNKILGKPVDKEDAMHMLQALQGREHCVYTGVTVYIREKNEETKTSFSECTKVKFYAMSDEEIKGYVSTGEPMDKAGAYGIQGIGGRFVQEIHGDYNNVVGLPVAGLYQKLKFYLEKNSEILDYMSEKNYD